MLWVKASSVPLLGTGCPEQAGRCGMGVRVPCALRDQLSASRARPHCVGAGRQLSLLSSAVQGFLLVLQVEEELGAASGRRGCRSQPPVPSHPGLTHVPLSLGAEAGSALLPVSFLLKG